MAGDEPEAELAPEQVIADSWVDLRRFTGARIALGRAGGSQRTAALLDFRMSQARARDAVMAKFRPEDVEERLVRMGVEHLRISTRATDRQSYLLRPDLGRALSVQSREELRARRSTWGPRDIAVIVSDGLSALAAETHAAATLEVLLPFLWHSGWRSFPVFIAPFGRVKLQDEVGSQLGARHSLMLLGERPGLSSPDSLGAYFTFQPNPCSTDADRNCVSNIRREGLAPVAAAAKLARLLGASAKMRLSGVALKDARNRRPSPT